MTLKKAQNISVHKNINCINIIITLGGTKIRKMKKMTTMQSEQLRERAKIHCQKN